MPTKLLIALTLILLASCAASRGVGDETFLATSRTATFGKDMAWQSIDLGESTPLVGTWDITDDKQIATGGEGNRTIIMAPMPNESVRVSFDVKLQSDHPDGWVGDITVLLGATADAKKFFTSGYALTTGSYWNNCSTFYRGGHAIAHTEWSPPRPNTWHHVVVEKIGGKLRYQLDGRIVLQAIDAQPLAIGEGERTIGLRTWETRMTVRNLTIETPKRK